MILAEFNLDQHDSVVSVTVSGHAEYSKKGSDIVCAAVSGQVAMLELGVLAYKAETTFLSKSSGFFTVRDDVSKQSEIQVLLRAFLLALLAVEQKYPKYISVKKNL